MSEPTPPRRSPRKPRDIGATAAPPKRVAKATAKAWNEMQATGKLHKVLYFDDAGNALGDYAPSQIPEDPFYGRLDKAGLQPPPLPLEQLVSLAEQHPIHSSCLEQKTIDTVGQGYIWVPDQLGVEEAAGTRDALDKWMHSLCTSEESMEEILQMAWDDQNTLGQGFLEIARDDTGKVRQLYYVPGHTIRFHHDGVRLAQIRGQKIVWFRRWGAPDDIEVDMHTGIAGPVGSAKEVANELLVFQKKSRRNSWYGIPAYISAIGWISLALAARDDNIFFFNNRREPRWAVIMTNLEDNGQLDKDLQQVFAVDLKNPHRNIFIPISGNGKIEFKQLTSDKMDGSFEKLSDRCDAQILIGHRVPPERLGMIKVGNLGGDSALDATRVYKEAVVLPAQALLMQRWNRFLRAEFAVSQARSNAKRPVAPADPGWTWKPVELDLAEEEQDIRRGVILFKAGVITMDEARVKAGMLKLDTAKFKLRPPQKIDMTTGEMVDDPEAAQYQRELGDMFVFEVFQIGGLWDTGAPGSAQQGDPGAQQEQPGDKLGGDSTPSTPDSSVDPNSAKTKKQLARIEEALAEAGLLPS